MSQPSERLEPSIIVIFGITGDLAQRYLLPALYYLFKAHLLDEKTQIIGLSRQDITVDELYGRVELCVNEVDNICDPVALKAIRDHSQLLKFDPGIADDYQHLSEKLQAVEDEQGVCMNRLFYLSIPPKLFGETVHNLGEAGLQTGCQHGTGKSRVLVEKPFGSNLASAEKLITQTNAVFAEDQVFRIDHYLAKETVQNILTFRRRNPIFASIWDNQHVEAIDILASEKIGIEGRTEFYEGVGALRDLIQSHLLQLLAATTLELPLELDSDAIHDARRDALAAIIPADPVNSVRGQYDSYRAEVNNPDSQTETFARLKLAIDSERWRGVPVTITTGKALTEKETEVIVTFTDRNEDSPTVNVLTFRIQPAEGINLQLRVKKPGFEHDLQDASMDFSYQQTFGKTTHPDAYERVLVDAIKGDRTLFATNEEVLASWRIIEPVLKAWQQGSVPLQTYAAGSAGPGSD